MCAPPPGDIVTTRSNHSYRCRLTVHPSGVFEHVNQPLQKSTDVQQDSPCKAEVRGSNPLGSTWILHDAFEVSGL